MGKKALELGGNAVLAYKQFFDVEGDSGLVARACGTACYISAVGKSDTSASGDVSANSQQRNEPGDEDDSEPGLSKDEQPPVLPPVDAIDTVASPRYLPRRFPMPTKPPEALNISVHDVRGSVVSRWQA